jgi:hypothetical protein
MTPRLLIAQLALLGALLGACAGTPQAPVGSGTAPTPAPALIPTPTPSVSGMAQVTPGPAPGGSPGQATACPGRIEVVRSLGTPVDDKSTDWAGYSVSSTSTPFACVEATWTQPAVVCSGTSLKAVAFWVGIGGVGQRGLVQTGAETQCNHGSPLISVWQQSLPTEAYAVAVDLAVSVGDRVHAMVLAVSRSTYTMTVENLTTGAAATATAVNKTVDPTTAEWIAEAPTLGCPAHCSIATLPDFGTVTFTGVSTTIGGVNAPLDAAGFVHTRTTLTTPAGLARAKVSATGKDGRSFAVTWERP